MSTSTPRQRRGALDVSGWSSPAEPAAAVRPTQPAQARSFSGSKRTGEDINNSSPSKRARALPPALSYLPPRGIKIHEESAEFIVNGEDEGAIRNPSKSPNKRPVRILHEFAVYRASDRTLAPLDEENIYAAGYVRPLFETDEDRGLEEELEAASELQYVELGCILKWELDYFKLNDPVYILTTEAWYILDGPSQDYQDIWGSLLDSHVVTQIVICHVLEGTVDSYATLRDAVQDVRCPSGGYFTEADLLASIKLFKVIVDEEATASEQTRLFKNKAIEELLESVSSPSSPTPAHLARPAHRAEREHPVGLNVDLAVLRPENQLETHVTPLVAGICGPYYPAQTFHVLGSESTVKSIVPSRDSEMKKLQGQLWHIVKEVRRLESIEWTRQYDWDKVASRRERGLVSTLKIDNKEYKVGDVIITLWGVDDGQPGIPPPSMPTTYEGVVGKTLGDYFWFAQVVSFDTQELVVHVRWLQHARQTVMAEVGHQQELYICPSCQDIKLQHILGKVKVVLQPPNPATVPFDQYFAYLMYDPTTASFSDPDWDQITAVSASQGIPSCPICEEKELQKAKLDSLATVHPDGGVVAHTHAYHPLDWALFELPDHSPGPGFIGQITGFHTDRLDRSHLQMVTLRRLGRICMLPDDIIPQDIGHDIHHLYLTDETITVDISQLIQPIYVAHHAGDEDLIKLWVSLGDNHFYAKYWFPSLTVISWDDCLPLTPNDFTACGMCMDAEIQEAVNLQNFLEQEGILSTMDLFAGTCAFSKAMESSYSSMSVTHAIEISPSASDTIRYNSRFTEVYNQDANVMLRYAVKQDRGHDVKVPRQIGNPEQEIPKLPLQGKIKVMVVGFPCQSHSDLNQFKKANDQKSNLILTALSEVDHRRPDYIFFENVPGFLRYSPNASQAGVHRLEGGLKMGGLKLMIRVLTAMKYQVCFGLLQAGHYGTPQRRIRFFVVAAASGKGLVLPELPQPTHDFPEKSLSITLTTGAKIIPIRTKTGTALHPATTIADALGDLPSWNWKDPASDHQQGLNIEVPDPKEIPYCGLLGQIPYRSPAKTTFQKHCREETTSDLQHITRSLSRKRVLQTLAVPTQPHADYQNWPQHFHEFQTSNAASAIARQSFKKGFFGRLDGQGFFSTTVTHVDPTGKQSKVLHPWDQRMVSVRELARSQGFPDHWVFKARDNNPVTLHRQIGNAVPWQLGQALGRSLMRARFQQWKKDNGLD